MRRKIYDCRTNVIVEEDEDVTQRNADALADAARLVTREATRQAERQAIATKLGITLDEVRKLITL